MGRGQPDDKSWDEGSASVTARHALRKAANPLPNPAEGWLTAAEVQYASTLSDDNDEQARFFRTLSIWAEDEWDALSLLVGQRREAKAGDEPDPPLVAALRLVAARRLADGSQRTLTTGGEPEATLVYTIEPLLELMAAHVLADYVPQLEPSSIPVFGASDGDGDGKALDGGVVVRTPAGILGVVAIEVNDDETTSDMLFNLDLDRARAASVSTLRILRDHVDASDRDEFFNAKVFGVVISRCRFVAYRMEPQPIANASLLDFKVNCETFDVDLGCGGIRKVAEVVQAFTEVMFVEARATVQYIKRQHVSRPQHPLLAFPGGTGGTSGTNGTNRDETKTSDPVDVAQEEVEAFLAARNFHGGFFDLDEYADFCALLTKDRTQVVHGYVMTVTLVLKHGAGAAREFDVRRRLQHSQFIMRAQHEALTASGVLVLVLSSAPSVQAMVGCSLGIAGDAGCRRVAGHVLGGLHELHALGYVHRDVKPDNVRYITGRSGAALNDFDLALPVEDLRASGVGTHCFIAPEMRRGGDEDASSWLEGERLAAYRACVPEAFDRRCACPSAPHAPTAAIDLWSLGATLACIYGASPLEPRVWTELSCESTATELAECLLNPCPLARGTAGAVRERLRP